ncbi:MAG: hypothetical protein H6757_00325 [Candidatus Omnitrophica bacterium]|nr:hypothetical protein [Candidatus Omnitrophota bacterium]
MQSLKDKKNLSQMTVELDGLLNSSQSLEQKTAILNRYKDEEKERIDERYVSGRVLYPGELSDELTDLADVVIKSAWKISLAQAAEDFGSDPVKETALFALSRFAARELDDSSTLDLLMVYRSGSMRKEFYHTALLILKRIMQPSQAGIFEVNTRFGPADGETTGVCSTESFEKYYASDGGMAQLYERQALIQLRPIAGSAEIFRQICAIRDAHVYHTRAFNIAQATALRVRQQTELALGSRFNVRYSAGGLLDIECLIQTLQITHGRYLEGDVRNPNTLKAMRALWKNGVLGEKHFQDLRAAYVFIRGLLNVMWFEGRGACGWALPVENTPGFVELGRKMGYTGNDREVQAAFKLAYQHHRAAAERLYDSYMINLANMAWEDIPGTVSAHPEYARPSLDELLRGEMNERSEIILRQLGFKNIDESTARLRRLCPNATAFEPFAKTVDLTWRMWPEVPDPDMALENFEIFSQKNEDAFLFWHALSKSDRALKLMLTLFGTSRYLSKIYIRSRPLWGWLEDTSVLTLDHALDRIHQLGQAEYTIEQLRMIKQQETLRIALCEWLMGVPVHKAMQAYSVLTGFVLRAVYDLCFKNDSAALIACGDLGANQLNLSSDLELILIADQIEPLSKPLERFEHMLQEGAFEDFLFRIKISTYAVLPAVRTEVSPSEWLQQIKMRTIAGDLQKGEEWIRVSSAKIRGGFSTISETFITESNKPEEIECKLHQMLVKQDAEIDFSGWSFAEVLGEVHKFNLLNEDECDILFESYMFLRKIENRLSLFENHKPCGIPQDREDLRHLAKSLGFFDLGIERAEDLLMNKLTGVRTDVQRVLNYKF